MLRLIATTLFFLALVVHSAGAMASATFGGEIELTNEALQESTFEGRGRTEHTLERAAQLEFVKKLREQCRVNKCKIKEVFGKFNSEYQVTYLDGWWFQVSFDPGCVEILFKPSTTETLKTQAARIDRDIFGVGKTAGLTAWKEQNAHVNIGITSTFGNDAELFLRFFVDYANHPDLALGSLGLDLANGPPIAALKQKQQDELKKIIAEFYDGKLKTIPEIGHAILTRVYTETLEPGWLGNHYQAVGLRDLKNAEKARLELRAIWGQSSADDFIKIGNLMEARVRFLRSQKEPIEFVPHWKEEFLPSELKARFLVYVEETGEKFSDYVSLLDEEVAEAKLPAFFRDKAPSGNLPKTYFDLAESSPYVRSRMLSQKPNCAPEFAKILGAKAKN